MKRSNERTPALPASSLLRAGARAVVLAVLGALPLGFALAADEPCRDVEHLGSSYIVCSISPDTHRIGLHLNREGGRPYGSIGALKRAGVDFEVAMNGGMYRADLDALGLYVEGGRERRPVVTGAGWGNFHLLPNGVFYVSGTPDDQRFGVLETNAFEADRPDDLLHATQSGPMLVIDGELHPRFLPRSDSLKVRNGIGVTPDGRAHFAISKSGVRFHDFGTLFRDAIGAPNALFLDGTISTLESPTRQRGGFRSIGPIITATPREVSSEGGAAVPASSQRVGR